MDLSEYESKKMGSWFQVEGLGVICRSIGMAFPPINPQVESNRNWKIVLKMKMIIYYFRRKSLFQWLQGSAAEEIAQSTWSH